MHINISKLRSGQSGPFSQICSHFVTTKICTFTVYMSMYMYFRQVLWGKCRLSTLEHLNIKEVLHSWNSHACTCSCYVGIGLKMATICLVGTRASHKQQHWCVIMRCLTCRPNMVTFSPTSTFWLLWAVLANAFKDEVAPFLNPLTNFVGYIFEGINFCG